MDPQSLSGIPNVTKMISCWAQGYAISLRFLRVGAMAFTLPDDYGYVVLAHCLSWISNFYLTFNVAPQCSYWDLLGLAPKALSVPTKVKARKQYNVQYPALYAPDTHSNAEKFNSVQQLATEWNHLQDSDDCFVSGVHSTYSPI